MTLYASVLFTGGVTILMVACTLLVSPGILLYLMNIYNYVLWIYYMHLHTLGHYRFTYISVYGMSMSQQKHLLHSLMAIHGTSAKGF